MTPSPIMCAIGCAAALVPILAGLGAVIWAATEHRRVLVLRAEWIVDPVGISTTTNQKVNHG